VKAPEGAPNVVIVLTDDMRFGAAFSQEMIWPVLVLMKELQ
jgi:hypothetical protein